MSRRRSLALAVAAACACVAATSGDAAVARSGALAPGDCALTPMLDDQCEQWAIAHDGAGEPWSAAASPQGDRVFVAGKAGGEGEPWVTRALDAADGRELWKAERPAGIGVFAGPWGLEVSPDGATLYATGGTVAGRDPRATTVAYDAATGAERWSAEWTGPDRLGFDVATAIAVDEETVVVTGVADSGRRFCPEALCDFVTLGYDADTGRLRFQARYSSPSEYSREIAWAVALSPDGSAAYVTGYSGGGAYGTDDAATVGYAVTGERAGTQLWEARWDGVGQQLTDGGDDLAVSPDGRRVYVSATSDSLAEGAGVAIATIAYDAAGGGLLWQQRYDGPIGIAASAARAIVADPVADRVYTVGMSTGDAAGADRDYATIAYDGTSGQRSWVARLATPGFTLEEPWAAAVSPDGSLVYVTGGSGACAADDCPRIDGVTVAYRTSDGGQAWVARHNARERMEVGRAVTAPPDGRQVFVASVAASYNAEQIPTSTLLLAYPGSGKPGPPRQPRQPRFTPEQQPGDPGPGAPPPPPQPPPPARDAAQPSRPRPPSACARARQSVTRARAAVRAAQRALTRARRARGGRRRGSARLSAKRTLRQRRAALRRAERAVRRDCPRRGLSRDAAKREARR